MPTDAIDLSTAVVHNSPADIADWAVTTNLEQLTMRPGQNSGLSFKFSGNQTWPDYVPPGWDGPIQYTVWAGCHVGGRWHVAGFIQMWRTRPSTGAPILAYWRDWAYDKNRWGEMVDYRPAAGDNMIFFLSAGNARRGSAGPEPNVTSVRERTNAVMIRLPAGDDGDFSFAGLPPAPLPPTKELATKVDVDIAVDRAISELRKVSARLDELAAAIKAIQTPA